MTTSDERSERAEAWSRIEQQVRDWALSPPPDRAPLSARAALNFLEWARNNRSLVTPLRADRRIGGLAVQLETSEVEFWPDGRVFLLSGDLEMRF